MRKLPSSEINTELYSIGNERLDGLLEDTLSPPSFIVIAGHPGAGKTSLALSSCYKNAEIGHKCLYVTLQEIKEKILQKASLLGFDQTRYLENGSVRILEMPMTTTIDEFLANIQEIAVEEGYNIVVIDSITALFKPVKDQSVIRSWLQNYLFRLAQLLNGLIIGISEIPLGSKPEQIGT